MVVFLWGSTEDVWTNRQLNLENLEIAKFHQSLSSWREAMNIGQSEQFQYTLPCQFQKKLGLNIRNHTSLILIAQCLIKHFHESTHLVKQLCFFGGVIGSGSWWGMILLCTQNHHLPLARWSSRGMPRWLQMAAEFSKPNSRWGRWMHHPHTGGQPFVREPGYVVIFLLLQLQGRESSWLLFFRCIDTTN